MSIWQSGNNKTLRTALTVAMLTQCTVAGAARAGTDHAIRNVLFTVSGDTVEIRYDLEGPPNEPVTIEVLLKRESNPMFEYKPKKLWGDVNLLVLPATKKQIFWMFREEFPRGLDGDDYYFVVEAEPMAASKRSGATMWLIGGALAIGVGVGAWLLFGQQEDKTSTSATFPLPPGRPN